MATDAQKKHLEKAREARNANQAELKRVKDLEDRNESLEKLGDIFHDDSFSWMLYSRRVNDLRNSWPELYNLMCDLFGPTKY